MENSDNAEPRKRAAETMPTANPGLLGFRTARRREPQLFAAGLRRQTHHSPEASRAQPCLAPPAAKMTCRPTPVAAATSARSPGGDTRQPSFCRGADLCWRVPPRPSGLREGTARSIGHVVYVLSRTYPGGKRQAPPAMPCGFRPLAAHLSRLPPTEEPSLVWHSS